MGRRSETDTGTDIVTYSAVAGGVVYLKQIQASVKYWPGESGEFGRNLSANGDVTGDSVTRGISLHRARVLHVSGAPIEIHRDQENARAISLGQTAGSRNRGSIGPAISHRAGMSCLIFRVERFSKCARIVNRIRELIEGAQPDAFEFGKHDLGGPEVFPIDLHSGKS